MKLVFITLALATLLSIWTIWPIFSSKVIRLIKSLTRVWTDCFGSLYLRYSIWASPIDVKHQHSHKTPNKWNNALDMFCFPALTSPAEIEQNRIQTESNKDLVFGVIPHLVSKVNDKRAAKEKHIQWNGTQEN